MGWFWSPVNSPSKRWPSAWGFRDPPFRGCLTGRSRVSPDMALRLSRVLGRSAESWLAMQDSHSRQNQLYTSTVATLERTGGWGWASAARPSR